MSGAIIPTIHGLESSQEILEVVTKEGYGTIPYDVAMFALARLLSVDPPPEPHFRAGVSNFAFQFLAPWSTDMGAPRPAALEALAADVIRVYAGHIVRRDEEEEDQHA